jgi:ankyrin repeat protein
MRPKIRGKEDVMSSQPAPTRTLPNKPSLAQLRKQAKELLKSYRAGKEAAVAEVERFERSPDPANFALADAQRVLARAYGFSSWPALKNHVEGVNFEAFIAAAEAGDVAAVRRIAKARPNLINQHGKFGSALHCAVQRRNEELTRVLMQLGADARTGIYPHGDATSAYTIAVDREYSEIVTVIEHAEENRHARANDEGPATSAAVDTLRQAIVEGRAAEAIAMMEADPALIGACDVYGVTPLHLAAWRHDPALVSWLLDHGASPGALALRDSPVRRHDQPVESGKTPLDFAAIVAGWADAERESFFYFMENAHADPARFHETARLLLEKGAELTPRPAVALGDREAVLRMHREGRLPNEIHIFRGGLLGIAVRVNRLDMVATLLDLGLDPDESVPTGEGYPSWGMPLWFASMCGRHEIAELLLARGADVDAIVCACGDSMSMAADEKMKALLRKHGARLTVETVTNPETAQAILDGTVTAYCLDGTEPLTPKQAAEMLCGGDPEFIRMCLPHITRKRDDPWWNSVLMSAKLPEGLKLILDHGVRPDVPFEGGYTMLHHLATPVAGVRGAFVPPERQRIQRATMLLDAGASLTIRDSLLQSTPLAWACRWGKIELVRLYLKRGADAVESDAEPWATPLACATKRGHHEIIELLRSRGAGT